MEGKIINIQRFSTGDGPGIRTTVFFKGCPLKCRWCHNPESQDINFQLGYYKEKCLHCGKCVYVCPKSAITSGTEKNHIDYQLCDVCSECVKACPADALEVFGQALTVDEVMKQLVRDREFYGREGGVTLSGGEPLIQHQFVLELLKRMKAEGLHTALDTCGYCRWDIMEEILHYVDLVLYDIKHMDSEKHRQATGVDNTVILENFERIQRKGIKTRVRVPIIPGFNDDQKNFEQLALFLKQYTQAEVELLGYHVYGISKYEAIGKRYELEQCSQPSVEQMEGYRKRLKQLGVRRVR